MKKTLLAPTLILAALMLVSVEQAASGAGTFSTTGSLATERCAQTATLLPNGKVLIAGGFSGSVLASAELYDPSTGTWSATGSLSTARWNHAALLLPNGKVLVSGGSDANGNSLSSTEIYDPAAGTWSGAAPMQIGRAFHTATLMSSGKVLVAGGYNNSLLASSEIYDPIAGTWSYNTSSDMGSGRYYHTATLLPNGKVYVAGGMATVINGGPSASSAALLYDPTFGSWGVSNSLATARYNHTATLLASGKVLIVGGNNGSSAINSAELYDPTTGGRTTTGSLTTARYLHTATLLPNGKVLVVGGFDGANQFASAELYDPNAGTWSSAGSMLTSRYLHTAIILPNGKTLLVGSTRGTTTNAEVYDYAVGTWAATSSFGTARFDFTATLLGTSGKVLVAGGNISGSAIATAQIFDPVSGWSTTGSMTAAHTLHTATLLPSGKVLVANVNYEQYDPSTGTWSAVGAMTVPRQEHTATLLPNGKVLIAGGTNYPIVWPTAEIYDPATGQSLPTGSMSTARSDHTATLLPNGKVLLTGGGNASADIYDPATGTCSPTGSMSEARSRHSATLLPNGKVLVAGGFVSASAEIYDPATGTWSPTGSMKTARACLATLLPNGKVLVSGGTYGSLAAAEIYDPATGVWTATGTPAVERDDHVAALLPNGRVLIAGGYVSGGGVLASAELYDPGLGFFSNWQPFISSASFNGSRNLVLGGTSFSGVSGASGGNTQDSSTNYPVVQLRSLSNDQCVFLQSDPATSVTATSFQSVPVSNFPAGYALATVFTDGIPNSSPVLFAPVVAAPAIAVEQPVGTGIADGGSKDFGTVSVGGSTSLTFTIRNTGTANLTLTTPTKDGNNPSDFTVGAYGSSTVAAGGTTAFTVQFSPGAGGSRSAAIHIGNNSNGSINPYDITLTGTGSSVAAPGISVEQPAGSVIADGGSKDFGSVNVGSSASLSFTIRNAGTSTLSITGITKDGINFGDFTVGSVGNSTIAPSGTTTFNVKFSPATDGARSAAIHIASNVSGSTNPYDITLTGTGSASGPPPVATTGTVTSVTSSEATLQGTVNPNGEATTIHYEYGFDTNYGLTTTNVGIGSGTSVVSVPVTITGLQSSTVYHYRLISSNVAGTSVGTDQTFATATGPVEPTGSLDTGFGGTGSVIPTAGIAQSVTVQSDGKIVVCGTYYNGSNNDVRLLRLNSNGTLDTSFNGTGVVTTDFGGSEDGADVKIQSDGKIVVVGDSYDSSTGNNEIAVFRYNSNGSLDTTFNGTGRATVHFDIDTSGSLAICFEIQGDGKILVGGQAWDSSIASNRLVVARFNSNGTLDTTFNGSGKLNTGIECSECDGMALQSDGKMLFSALIFNGSSPDFAVVRLNVDGTLDTTFNGTGKVLTDFTNVNENPANENPADNYPRGRMVLQGDGKIVVAGYTASTGPDFFDTRFALERFNTNGSLDTSFGANGKVATSITGSDLGEGRNVALQSDGKILVVGYDYNTTTQTYDVALLRHNTDASLDTSFGSAGQVTTHVGSGQDFAYGLALQSNGSILVAGGANSGYMLVLRYGSPTTAPSPTPSQMTGLPNGSTLPSTTVTFSWDPGVDVADHILWVGSSPNTHDIYANDEGSNLSDTISGLPTDGRTIYVTLFSSINGSLQSNTYTYTAFTQSSGGSVSQITAVYLAGYPDSTITGVSADGTSVAGTATDGNNYQGFQAGFSNSEWVPNALGFLPQDDVSAVTAISNDTTVAAMVGYGSSFGFVYDGSPAVLKKLTPLSGDNTSTALGVCAGGTSVAGTSQLEGIGGGTCQAVLWGGAGGSTLADGSVPQGLGYLSGFSYSVAYGVCAFPTKVVGYCFNSNNTAQAFIWEPDSVQTFGQPLTGSMRGLSSVSGDTAGLAVAISADGSTVVGASGSGQILASGFAGVQYTTSGRIVGTSQAVFWKPGQNNSADPLNNLSGADYSIANAVSTDGTFIVGSSGTNPSGSDYSSDACIWTGGKVYKLADILTAAGVNLAGWSRLYEATGVSSNGDVVVGYGSYDGNQEGFRVSGVLQALADSLARTSTATFVTSGFATLNGSVNPNGAATTAYFQYGTTTNYGSSTPAINMGSGTSAVPTLYNLFGLTRSTAYHYRLVVVSGGTTYVGADQTFATPASSGPSWHSGQVSALTNPNMNNMADGARTGVADSARVQYWYKGTDSNIWVEWLNGTAWTQTRLSSDGNVNDWLTFGGQYNLLCYAGKDNQIWCVYWTGSAWATSQLGTVPGGTTIAGDVAIDNSWNTVYFRGTDNLLHCVCFNGKAWVYSTIGTNPTANLAGNLAVDKKYHLVYYKGTDNNLWAFQWTGTQWVQIKLTSTSANVGGAISVDVLGQTVYYRSSIDNSAACVYWNGKTWIQESLVASANINTSATSFSDTAPYTSQYNNLYIDGNNQAEVFWFNGSAWTHGVLGDGASNLTGGLSLQPVYHWIFARRSDGNIILFYYQ